MDNEEGAILSDNSVLLPPLASSLEPYIEHAVNARAQRSFRKGGHTKTHKPSAPTVNNFAKSPRASRIKGDVDGAFDNISGRESPIRSSVNTRPSSKVSRNGGSDEGYDSPGVGLFPEESIESPATRRRSSPETAGVGRRSSNKQRNYTLNSSPTHSPSKGARDPNGSSQFESALDSLAAMKMHDFVVNRKKPKSYKGKINEEIRGYKQMSMVEMETEIFDKFKMSLAAWKIRSFVEVYRRKQDNKKSSQKIARFSAEIVKLREFNQKLSRALTEETTGVNTNVSEFQTKIDDLTRQLKEHEEAANGVQEHVKAKEAAEANYNNIKMELNITKESFATMMKVANGNVREVEDKLTTAEEKLKLVTEELEKCKMEHEKQLEEVKAAYNAKYAHETFIPISARNNFPDFKTFAGYKDMIEHRKESELNRHELTIAEELQLLCNEYKTQQKALHEAALIGDSTSAYNSGLQRLVGELANKVKAAEDEIEVYTKSNAVCTSTIDTLNMRIETLTTDLDDVCSDRDMMADTIGVNLLTSQRKYEYYEAQLMYAEDKASMKFDMDLNIFLEARRDGSKIVIVKKGDGQGHGSNEVNATGSRVMTARSASRPGTTNRSEHHEDPLFSVCYDGLVGDAFGSTTRSGTAATTTRGGVNMVVRTELEERLLTLVRQLDGKLSQFDAQINPARVAGEKRREYFEQEVAQRDLSVQQQFKDQEFKIQKEREFWTHQLECLQDNRDNCERNMQTGKRKLIEIKGELRFIHRQKNHLKSVLRSWHEDYVLANQKEPTEEEQTVHTQYLMTAYNKAQSDLQEKLRQAMVVTLETTNAKEEIDVLTAKIVKAHRRAENGCSPTCSRPPTPSMYEDRPKNSAYCHAVAMDGSNNLHSLSGTAKDELYLNSALEDMRMSPIAITNDGDDFFGDDSTSLIDSWNMKSGKKIVIKDRNRLDQKSMLAALKEKITATKAELQNNIVDFKDMCEQLRDLDLVRMSLKESIDRWLVNFNRKNKREATLREKRADKEGNQYFVNYNNTQNKLKKHYAMLVHTHEKLVHSRTVLLETMSELALCQKPTTGIANEEANKKMEEETDFIEDQIMSDNINVAMSCVLPVEPEYFDPLKFVADFSIVFGLTDEALPVNVEPSDLKDDCVEEKRNKKKKEKKKKSGRKKKDRNTEEESDSPSPKKKREVKSPDSVHVPTSLPESMTETTTGKGEECGGTMFPFVTPAKNTELVEESHSKSGSVELRAADAVLLHERNQGNSAKIPVPTPGKMRKLTPVPARESNPPTLFAVNNYNLIRGVSENAAETGVDNVELGSGSLVSGVSTMSEHHDPRDILVKRLQMDAALQKNPDGFTPRDWKNYVSLSSKCIVNDVVDAVICKFERDICWNSLEEVGTLPLASQSANRSSLGGNGSVMSNGGGTIVIGDNVRYKGGFTGVEDDMKIGEEGFGSIVRGGSAVEVEDDGFKDVPLASVEKQSSIAGAGGESGSQFNYDFEEFEEDVPQDGPVFLLGSEVVDMSTTAKVLEADQGAINVSESEVEVQASVGSVPGGVLKESSVSSVPGGVLKEGSVSSVPGGVLKEGSVSSVPGGVLKEGSVSSVPGGVLKEGSVSSVPGDVLKEGSVSSVPGDVLKEGSVSSVAGGVLKEGSVSSVPGDVLKEGSVSSVLGDVLKEGSVDGVIITGSSLDVEGEKISLVVSTKSEDNDTVFGETVKHQEKEEVLTEETRKHISQLEEQQRHYEAQIEQIHASIEEQTYVHDNLKINYFDYDNKKEEIKRKIAAFSIKFVKTAGREPTLMEKKEALGGAYDELWKVQEQLKKVGNHLESVDNELEALRKEDDHFREAVHIMQANIRYLHNHDAPEGPSVWTGGTAPVPAKVERMDSFIPRLSRESSAMPAMSRDTSVRSGPLGISSPVTTSAPLGVVMEAFPLTPLDLDTTAVNSSPSGPGSPSQNLNRARKQLINEIDAQAAEIKILQGYVRVAKGEVRDAKRRKAPIKNAVRDWMDAFEQEFGRAPKNFDKTSNEETIAMFEEFDRATNIVNQALEHQKQTELVLSDTIEIYNKKKHRLDILTNSHALDEATSSIERGHLEKHEQYSSSVKGMVNIHK